MANGASTDATTSAGESVGTAAEGVLQEYLSEIRAIRATGEGVTERSYYPAISNLFNSVGKTLKPKVLCVMDLKKRDERLPDGGLFTADQFQRQIDAGLKAGQLPARGAIEAKGPKPDVKAIAETKQVKDYLKTYGIVIVTNLRDFLIVERGANQQVVERESFSLADGEADFWQHKAAHPRKTAKERGEQFLEFIKRACLHAAPLVNPKDVAWFLASYARDALARVEHRKDLPALQAVRSALEEALGMKFTAEKGEHFFRSTLVQTIFYGVFSAWVRWHKDNPAAKAGFDWRTAEWTLHVPFIRVLYEQVASKSQLEPLGLVEVLDWAAGVLNRVDREEFFKRFELEHAVQYFYEPFLEAYDPELRKALGVWYTPPEIVKYQVARVDTVLREELNLPDGLADPNVIVLDPCCGTAAYLLEVLRCIERTSRAKHDDALVGYDVKNAAMTRVFGFEILPAPFVIAHLQIGLLLQQTGLPLSLERSERAGVYLTNALTGWQLKAQPPLALLELEEERRNAGRVKRDAAVLVVLGNPPYNAFAGTSPEEEEGLVEVYKGAYEAQKKRTGKTPTHKRKTRYDRDGKVIPEKDTVTRYKLNDPPEMGGWGIKKFNLDDLYVRFFRLAERRIAEMTGKGVVSFISNHSWISEPSFVVLRQHLLDSFDKFWVENLHGNRKISEYAPDGGTSETIFAIHGLSVGIQQGVATSLWVKTGKPRTKQAQVRFRDDINDAKAEDRRTRLLRTLQARRFDAAYARCAPSRENRFSFRPEDVAVHYTKWPRVLDLCAIVPSNGLMEKRGGALIDIERADLEARMRDYFDRELSWDDYKDRRQALTKTAARFNAREARAKALSAESFDADRIRRYALRPYDSRWCYYTGVRPVWNEPRPSLWGQFWSGNSFIITRFRTSSHPEGAPMAFTRALLDDHFLMPDAVAVPIRLRNGERLSKSQHATLFDVLGSEGEDERPAANLSKAAREYLVALCVKQPDADIKTAALIWMHTLAIGYSPAYLAENADGIRRDWPRIPLPDERKLLDASAALGGQVAALLDTEADAPAVTSGKLRPLFRAVGVPSRIGGGELNPNAGDFAVTVGWGHFGKGDATMPGKGKLVERKYDDGELKAISAEAAARGLSPEDALRLLGASTFDVYLNDQAYWRNIPTNVWDYHIGGYQVIKKWLSYREHELLGRALTPDEAREVMNMARRIAAIILLQPTLDENYRRVAAACYEWPKQDASP